MLKSFEGDVITLRLTDWAGSLFLHFFLFVFLNLAKSNFLSRARQVASQLLTKKSLRF
jgi:hypothetical protein